MDLGSGNARFGSCNLFVRTICFVLILAMLKAHSALGALLDLECESYLLHFLNSHGLVQLVEGVNVCSLRVGMLSVMYFCGFHFHRCKRTRRSIHDERRC